MNLTELIAKGASEEEIRAAGGTDEDVPTATKVAEAIAVVDSAKPKKELSQKEFAGMLVEGIGEQIKKLNLGKVERKHAIFGTKDDPNGEKMEKLEFASENERKHFELLKSASPEESFKYAKNLRVKHFFKNVMTKENSVAKALSEGVGADGGFLVPAEFTAEVIKLANQYGLARRECRIRTMSGIERQIPKKNASASAYWVNEGAEITESQPSFKLLTLMAKKLAALVPTTNELLADTQVDVVGEIRDDAVEAITEEEDNQLFNGVGAGSSPFVGILNNSDVNVTTMGSGDTAFSNLAYDDLVDIKNSVVAAALEGAKWYMHRSVVGIIEKLKDTANMPIWANPIAGSPASLLGFPVVLSDKMEDTSAVSTKFLIFGNLRKGVSLGQRKDLEVKYSDQSGDDFKKDMGRFRFITRSGILVELGEALACLKTAAS